jgi:hypothetical protein
MFQKLAQLPSSDDQPNQLDPLEISGPMDSTD